jgi:hypothetical protein
MDGGFPSRPIIAFERAGHGRPIAHQTSLDVIVNHFRLVYLASKTQIAYFLSLHPRALRPNLKVEAPSRMHILTHFNRNIDSRFRLLGTV